MEFYHIASNVVYVRQQSWDIFKSFIECLSKFEGKSCKFYEEKILIAINNI